MKISWEFNLMGIYWWKQLNWALKNIGFDHLNIGLTERRSCVDGGWAGVGLVKSKKGRKDVIVPLK